MALDVKGFEDLLACPACRSKVLIRQERVWCTNGQCRRSYTIENEIPQMLVAESRVEEHPAPARESEDLPAEEDRQAR